MDLKTDHPTSPSAPDVSDEKQHHAVRDEVYIDPQEEKALLRKLDRWIVPPVMLLYLFSFLDRVNIGNARLYGMEEDLKLKENEYQIAVSLLFVTYIASELPRVQGTGGVPDYFGRVGGGVVSWVGYVALMGWVRFFPFSNRELFLSPELSPFVAIYLTLFYTKREYALRIGYLFVSAAIAGSLGGIFAYGIGHMDGIAGLRGWRWIMIIEGIPTVILGVSIWWWFADSVETAHYLTPREKELISLRRRLQIGHTKSSDQMHKADVYEGFRDWKIWLFCVGQFGGDMILYGFSTFLPTIIKTLGDWSVAEVQALTIPCYGLGAISYLVVAYFSDRTQKRAIFTVVFAVICAAGYAILVSPAPGGVRYFGCFLVATGLYVIVGLPLAWLPSNNPRYGKRTTATGLQLTIGNSAGIAAPFIYPTEDGPRYVTGHAVSMAMAAMSAVVYLLFWAWFRRQNQRKLDGKDDHKIQGMTEEEAEELGEHNPKFIYAY
ncbi:hypothetical protein Q7P36_010352 [Cladosporium allicinum]